MLRKRLDCPICGSATYYSNRQIYCDDNKCNFHTDAKRFDFKCGFFSKDKSCQLLNKNRCQNDSIVIIHLYTNGYLALCMEHAIEKHQLICDAKYWYENKKEINIVKNILPLKFGKEVPLIPEPTICHLNENYFLSKEQVKERHKNTYDGRRNCVICGPYYVEKEKQNEPHVCEGEKLRKFIGFLAGKSHS